MADVIQLREFTYKGSPVRTVGSPERPEFVAADVCAVLGLLNPSKALADFTDDEKGLTTSYTSTGPKQLLTVTEPGLYRLIQQSRKPGARAFQRWINHDVIPTIRKTGRYELEPKTEFQSLLPDRIAPAVEEIRGHTKQIAEGQARLETKADAIFEIVDGYRKRRDFSEVTRNRGRRCIRESCDGRCPFCNRKNADIQFDHWDGNRSNNSVSNLACPCRRCHEDKSRDELKFRRTWRSHQEVFQEKLAKTPSGPKLRRSAYNKNKKRCELTRPLFEE